MTTITVNKIERGCGERKVGGLYVRVATGPFGMPLEHFLIDEPMPYLGECNRQPFFTGDDCYFWVGAGSGEEHGGYPYVPDFVEEARLYGISKRISLQSDLKKFKPGVTRMFFIHPRAVAGYKAPVHTCPRNKDTHLAGDERCITGLYHLIEAKPLQSPDGPCFARQVGSTTYTTPTVVSLDGINFGPGIFMWLPFSHFEYVVDGLNQVDKRIQKAIDAGLPILCVKEEE